MSHDSAPAPSIWRPVISGLLGGAAAWCSVFLVAAALQGLIEPLGQPAGRWAGLIILLAVSFLFGAGLARRVGPRGMLAAAIGGATHSLLLLSMILTAAEGDRFNPLIFGWAGLSANVLLAVAGGWLGQRWRRVADKSGAGARPEIRLGVNLMLLWLACEFLIRLWGATGLAAMVGSPRGGDMLATLLLLPTAVHWMGRYAAAHGMGQADLGYRRDRQAQAAGLLGGVLLLGAVLLTAPIDAWLFASPATGAEASALPVEAPWVAGLLLLVNGVVIPICEERIWRGAIQTSLVRGWGLGLGLIVTALAFSLKHVVIDGSPGRLVTLFAFGLIVGLIRSRWGTTASTLAHSLTNLAATAMMVGPALLRL